jgi:hypothetical protein
MPYAIDGTGWTFFLISHMAMCIPKTFKLTIGQVSLSVKGATAIRSAPRATRDCVAGQAALKALPNHVVIEMEDHRCKSLLMTWQLRLQMGHRHRCRNRQDVCGRRYESLTRNGFVACHMSVACL